MGYKTTDGLMRHLRDSGIEIAGSAQKRQLLNTGYYHGYKGYRFFKNSQNRLSFSSYEEIYATIQYDSNLKSLLYGKVMFIETAVKNIALERILINAKSEKISDMLAKSVSSYNNAPAGSTHQQRQRLQENKLNLQKTIQSSIAYAYHKKNPKITHFYNYGHTEVPIWALFEILTMGDFAHLLECLTYDVRDDISRHLGLNLSCDTKRELVYKYIYLLKDLRNAIAHNAVVFDTRFRNFDPNKPMKQCLEREIGIQYVNFKTIGDYVLLIGYFLKLLHVTKTEMKNFVREFEDITDHYKNSVNPHISSTVVQSDLSTRMTSLKKYF